MTKITDSNVGIQNNLGRNPGIPLRRAPPLIVRTKNGREGRRTKRGGRREGNDQEIIMYPVFSHFNVGNPIPAYFLPSLACNFIFSASVWKFHCCKDSNTKLIT